MKLASFAVETDVGPISRVGVVEQDTYVDVTAGYAASLSADGEPDPESLAEAIAPPDMIDFLARGDRAFEAARQARSFAADSDCNAGPGGARITYGRDDVRLLAPVPRPNSIRDFMLFEKHIRNSLGEVPDVMREMPVYYKGNPDSVVPPGETVHWPSYTDELDYELELCAIVGKRGRDISAADAEEYIAGYTIFNDFTARDIQMHEMESNLGPAKGKDFANGFGPFLATPDELDIQDCRVRAEVNGEVWSSTNTSEMVHTFPTIIEHVSQDETLYPGDMLGTGTVGDGCGLELDKWLQPGDTITLSAEGIGSLEHHIGPRKS